MMTMLKYDFRRSWNTLLAGLVILILVQVGQTLFLSNVTGNVLGIMAYVGAGVAIYVRMIKSYTANIRSYNRRLIPVTGLSHVLSPLIFGALNFLGLLLIGFIHFYLYTTLKLGLSLSDINMTYMSVTEVISTLLFAGWIVLFMTVIIFFSISVAGSFRWKTGPWIGIVTFLVMVNLLSWLENVIFSGKFSPNDLFQFTEESTGISFTANGVIWAEGRWGSTVFEIGLAALLVWGIIYMNNKKVEV
ncbi:hypothetical protein [Paenibacillus silvae]|uniref:ABC transporter permease n=1 Tax=Paenibacillus silvae TaxID=1325358 RepID=A0ABQ1ZD37_9BACL|nr:MULTISPECIES: hypothetical protein [Paenibacillus]MCK6077775.1 hypothetical protein [Paenibacillus silvae]MCK6151974.1 hypothetical protein [Paenibacillus silvae]MCK6270659.1 hypothetical protein [Paenibacillus silvae]GGH57218.1 hypothetical protein GCM10008014_28650 [Paenibacillus silvae]